MVVAGVACDSQTIVVDNEPEVAGRALDAWAYAKNVTLRFIRPGKPKVRTRKMIRELRTPIASSCSRLHRVTRHDWEIFDPGSSTLRACRR
jgi:hypothetical protein